MDSYTRMVRKVLNNNMGNIVENVSQVTALLPYLTLVLTQQERESIRNKHDQKSNSEATVLLVEYLCKKSGLAFESFTAALRTAGAEELAKQLESELHILHSNRVNRCFSAPDGTPQEKPPYQLLKQSSDPTSESTNLEHGASVHSSRHNFNEHGQAHPHPHPMPQQMPHPQLQPHPQRLPMPQTQPQNNSHVASAPIERMLHRQDAVQSTLPENNSCIQNKSDQYSAAEKKTPLCKVGGALISKMPYKLHNRLVQLLDSPGDGNNWKMLASEAFEADIETIDLMERNGQTKEVLKRMGQKQMKIQDLVFYLKKIQRYDAVDEIVSADLYPSENDVPPVEETGTPETYCDEVFKDEKGAKAVVEEKREGARIKNHGGQSPVEESGKPDLEDQKEGFRKDEQTHSGRNTKSSVQEEVGIDHHKQEPANDELVDKEVQRYALLICNKDYTSDNLLPLDLKDEMTNFMDVLKNQGWNVRYEENCLKGKMESTLDEFAKEIRGSGVLVYIIGHSVQVHGENYFLPVDAKSNWSRSDILNYSLGVNTIIRKLEKAQMVLIIPDGGYMCNFQCASVISGLAPVPVPHSTAVILPAQPNVQRKTQDCTVFLKSFKSALLKEKVSPLWEMMEEINKETLGVENPVMTYACSNSRCILPWELNAREEPITPGMVKGFCEPRDGSKKFALICGNTENDQATELKNELGNHGIEVSRIQSETSDNLEQQLREYIEDKSKEGMITIFIIFSGLVAKVKDENYLLGKEQREPPTEVEPKFVKVQWLLNFLAENILGRKIVIIDNPDVRETLKTMAVPAETLLSISTPAEENRSLPYRIGSYLSSFVGWDRTARPEDSYLTALKKEFVENPSLPYHEMLERVGQKQSHAVSKCLFYS